MHLFDLPSFSFWKIASHLGVSTIFRSSGREYSRKSLNIVQAPELTYWLTFKWHMRLAWVSVSEFSGNILIEYVKFSGIS